MSDELNSAIHSLVTSYVSDPLTDQEVSTIYSTLSNIPTGFNLVGDTIAKELDARMGGVYDVYAEVFSLKSGEPNLVVFPEDPPDTASMVSYVTSDLRVEHVTHQYFLDGKHSLPKKYNRVVFPEYCLEGYVQVPEMAMEAGALSAVSALHDGVQELVTSLLSQEDRLSLLLPASSPKTVQLVGIRKPLGAWNTDGYSHGSGQRGWGFETIRSTVVYSWS